MVSAMAAAKTDSVNQGDFQETDIGLIPSDWDIEELGNIGSAFIGLTYSPRDVHTDGTLVLRSSNVQNGRLRFDDNVYVKVEVPERAIVRENDILICVRNGSRDLIGKSAVIDAPSAGMAFGAFMGLYRSEHNNFLAHVFKSDIVMRQIREHLGATINQITNKSLNGFKAPLPKNSDEREAIADALSDADALIESLEQLIAKKRQIKQGAMQELLTGKRRLVNSDLDWTTATLGSLAKIQRGASPRPIDDTRWFDENSKVGWVRISDVTSSTMYLTETTQKLSPDGIQKSRPVQNGALIMSICATVGRPIITNIDVCIHDGFVVFDDLRVDRDFLYYVLAYLEKDWSKHGQTGSQMNLNTTLINTTEISFPEEKAEQELIAHALLAIDDELNLLNTRLSKAKQIKQGMMQELLTGRIRLV
jgi:type I restriction enzyme S subunit